MDDRDIIARIRKENDNCCGCGWAEDLADELEAEVPNIPHVSVMLSFSTDLLRDTDAETVLRLAENSLRHSLRTKGYDF